MKKTINKGAEMEERLRRYFLNLGYYVLRGVKFRYNSFDVTDVDLWLYMRASALSRLRVNVDIKNKKTPQALERIFWAKGLKDTLGLDECIVATTDTRPDVREFGLVHKVTVLDGPFLMRLQDSNKTYLERISEEEFLEQVEHVSLGKIGGDWKGLYEKAKSRCLTNLQFDTCNAHLNDIQYFFEQQLSSRKTDDVLLRLIYVLTSMFIITVDFILKDHFAMESKKRYELLCEGLRYGDSGREQTKRLIKIIATIIPTNQKGIIDELNQQAQEIPSEGISEFLSKQPVQGILFTIALHLEAAAFSPIVQPPSKLSTDAQSILGILIDFFGFDRKKLLT